MFSHFSQRGTQKTENDAEKMSAQKFIFHRRFLSFVENGKKRAKRSQPSSLLPTKMVSRGGWVALALTEKCKVLTAKRPWLITKLIFKEFFFFLSLSRFQVWLEKVSDRCEESMASDNAANQNNKWSWKLLHHVAISWKYFSTRGRFNPSKEVKNSAHLLVGKKKSIKTLRLKHFTLFRFLKI